MIESPSFRITVSTLFKLRCQDVPLSPELNEGDLFASSGPFGAVREQDIVVASGTDADPETLILPYSAVPYLLDIGPGEVQMPLTISPGPAEALPIPSR